MKNNWRIYQKDSELIIELNGGVNSIFDMEHSNFDNNKAAKKKEIEHWAAFTKTTVDGMEYLD